MVKGDFIAFIAEIFVKIFQIVFAMLVIGIFLRDEFNYNIFFVGVVVSLFCLTTSISLYYNATVKGVKK